MRISAIDTRKFDQFREGAVQSVRETGRPIAQIARDWDHSARWGTGSPTTIPIVTAVAACVDYAGGLKRLRG